MESKRIRFQKNQFAKKIRQAKIKILLRFNTALKLLKIQAQGHGDFIPQPQDR